MHRLLLPSLATVVASVVLTSAQQPPTFGSAVDLIAVDVQVVDKAGVPVSGLPAGQFQVSIDGKLRKVVAADFIRAEAPAAASADPGRADLARGGERAAASAPGGGRVYI